jgi:hypothetical protein
MHGATEKKKYVVFSVSELFHKLPTLVDIQWESIIVPIHKKGDKTDCNNYRGISLLPTTYKILSNILLSAR